MCGQGDASCNKACRRGICRRRSRRSFSGMDYGAHDFACVLQIIIYVLFWCDKFLIVALWCRGGPNKCPMAISDFVLLHNKAAEGLAKHDRVGYDIYSGIADTKALFIKYCKQFEKAHSLNGTDAPRCSSRRWRRSDKCLHSGILS